MPHEECLHGSTVSDLLFRQFGMEGCYYVKIATINAYPNQYDNDQGLAGDETILDTHDIHYHLKERSYKREAHPLLFSGIISGYPRVVKRCSSCDDHIITISQVLQVQLMIPSQCLADDVEIALTVYYIDPPYTDNLQMKNDDGYLIYVSPIIRLEPMDCFTNETLRQIPKDFKFTSLSAAELEKQIMENGLYQITFNEDGLNCKNSKLLEQTININWNVTLCYYLHYQCFIISPNRKSTDVANRIVTPIGDQRESNPKYYS
ncbi:uncharacterized protein TRIADDRAFT_52810 [Trichoplax adhaerens]|uniref:Uncharacterized protein n=1 Tax=Trichoplax adhaerens TaxID=10228 RepID=B3RKL1_TRIAD|nr:predicted protein [Trichoplax adhaerens]EDV29182.1 predicted protein [Trichoplax adhaerens]|eukprot:XP_002108384.1 predicted protein [Trichoplax adhaerens]